MSLLELRDVDARYGEIRALHGVSLSVEDGDFVAVLGANGAGKTTTLRAISGTVKTTGDVFFEGEKIFRRTPEAMARRGIAHVPEGRGTFTTLSVLDNLRLGAWVQRGTSHRDLARVFEFFPRLYERRDQQAGSLSGGEQQMLALGRAMMAKPRVLLLDEPSLGLAPLVVAGDLRRAAAAERGRHDDRRRRAEREARARFGAPRVRARDGAHRARRRVVRTASRRSCAPKLPRLLMANFFQQVVSGLASGGIYGSLALAIVLIHRATGVLNFAQGELATLSTFICWTLVDHGWSFWPAFGATIALSFGGGVVLEQTVIRPLQNGPLLGMVILTIGLLIAVNGLDTWIWGGAPRQFKGPFSTAPIHVGGVALSKQDLGVIVVSLVTVLFLAVLFGRTKFGLGLRAAAVNPTEARLTGVRVPAMLAVGWGLAAALGAVAGVMAAPTLLLEPNMMQTVLLYAFAAAVLGGMDSPIGAVIGGLLLGVLLNLVGTYVHWVGGELRLAVALAVILSVLLVRPAGLFGSPAVRRA